MGEDSDKKEEDTERDFGRVTVTDNAHLDKEHDASPWSVF